jgi:hypothetical protein
LDLLAKQRRDAVGQIGEKVLQGPVVGLHHSPPPSP